MLRCFVLPLIVMLVQVVQLSRAVYGSWKACSNKLYFLSEDRLKFAAAVPYCQSFNSLSHVYLTDFGSLDVTLPRTIVEHCQIPLVDGRKYWIVNSRGKLGGNDCAVLQKNPKNMTLTLVPCNSEAYPMCETTIGNLPLTHQPQTVSVIFDKWHDFSPTRYYITSGKYTLLECHNRCRGMISVVAKSSAKVDPVSYLQQLLDKQEIYWVNVTTLPATSTLCHVIMYCNKTVKGCSTAGFHVFPMTCKEPSHCVCEKCAGQTSPYTTSNGFKSSRRQRTSTSVKHTKQQTVGHSPTTAVIRTHATMLANTTNAAVSANTTNATVSANTTNAAVSTNTTNATVSANTMHTAMSTNTTYRRETTLYPVTSQESGWIQIGEQEYYVSRVQRNFTSASDYCTKSLNATLLKFIKAASYFETMAQLYPGNESFWVSLETSSHKEKSQCLILSINTLTIANCREELSSICSRTGDRAMEVLRRPEFVKMLQEMTVNKSTTLRTRMKRGCAEDGRTYTRTAGGVSGLIFCLVVTVLVVFDVTKFTKLCNNCSKVRSK